MLKYYFTLIILSLSMLLEQSFVFASSPYLQFPDKTKIESTPAFQYANMKTEQVFIELENRKIPFIKVGGYKSVRDPIRLTGPMHGVTFHSVAPESKRSTDPFEVLDGRLALALDDFSILLNQHNITDVTHFSLYRPNGWNRKSKKKAAPGTRHPAGLAIDVGVLQKSDGTIMNVRKDFQGKIGSKTCGEGVVPTKSDKAKELRKIVCDSGSSSIFTYILSPNYNFDHRDHFHMEIRPNVKWVLYQ